MKPIWKKLARNTNSRLGDNKLTDHSEHPSPHHSSPSPGAAFAGGRGSMGGNSTVSQDEKRKTVIINEIIDQHHDGVKLY